jgi:hypothetical protein
VGAWQAIQYVGSGLSLVAFIVAALLFAYRARLRHQATMIQSAPGKDRLEAIAVTAQFFRVDTKKLSPKQQEEVIIAQITARSRRDLILAVMAVVIAILLASVAVVAIFHPQTAPYAESIASLDPPYQAVDNKTSFQRQHYLAPYEFIDVQKCDKNIYILSRVRERGDTYIDPQGQKFPVFNVFLIKMTPNELFRSLVTTLRVSNGTLDCESDPLRIFINYKLQNGAYDMGGAIYTRRKDDLSDIRVDTQFTEGNKGWYPRFTQRGLEYFDYGGYYRTINNIRGESQRPEDAENLFDIYQISRSDGILPNGHDVAVGRIIAKLNAQPNSNNVLRPITSTQ